MGNCLFTSSIGRKLIMSISGLFLVLFLLFHMSMNLAAVFSTEAYNAICEFLGANWYALVGTLVLAAGFLVHIIYASILTLRNRAARGDKRYAVTAMPAGVSWASRNMYILGAIVVLGLILHLYNFWYKMQFAEIIGDHNLGAFGPTDGAWCGSWPSGSTLRTVFGARSRRSAGTTRFGSDASNASRIFLLRSYSSASPWWLWLFTCAACAAVPAVYANPFFC